MLLLLIFSLVLRKIVFMVHWKNASVELRYSEWDLLLLYTTLRCNAVFRGCPLTLHAMFLTVTTYSLTKLGQRASKGGKLCIKDALDSSNTVNYLPCSWTIIIGQLCVSIYKYFLHFLLSQMNNPISIGSYMIEIQIFCFLHISDFCKSCSYIQTWIWILDFVLLPLMISSILI